MNTLGILTSGGDAPGMNAAIRAVVRASLYYKKTIKGIYQGYDGVIEGNIKSMNEQSVANIVQRGGTVLKTARSKAFKTIEGRQKAYKQLVKHEIDGLIVIGGDGSFRGAKMFSDEHSFPVIGIPGTIDNDIYGTDFTIGYDTAINTVTDAVNKIRDTAESHSRVFIVEVMGRDSGLIAVRSGIAVGAEAIFVPELKHDIQYLLHKLEKGRKDKSSKIILVSEGEKVSDTYKIADMIKKTYSYLDVRVSILGHMQRGGSPSCMDRVLASRIGVAAVEKFINSKGIIQEMIGIKNNKIIATPLSKAEKYKTALEDELTKIIKILSY